jgi:thiol-disulfide isomerase/thioredoxin
MMILLLLEKRFNQLDAIVRKSDGGQQLAQIIANNKIGQSALNHSILRNPIRQASPVTLSSFHGKYVLIDFWASWCGPCRNENPNVVENFKKFNNKNFTILSVSLDKPGQKEKWIEAIHHDILPGVTSVICSTGTMPLPNYIIYKVSLKTY